MPSSRQLSVRFLSEDERVQLGDLRRRGLGVRAIAAKLERSPSTVSRELRRNRDPSSGQYRPFAAQRLAVDRRARPGRGKLLGDDVLREFVQGRLKKRWSPEQISQALRWEFPEEWGLHLAAVGSGCGAARWSGLSEVLRRVACVVRRGLEVPGLPRLVALA